MKILKKWAPLRQVKLSAPPGVRQIASVNPSFQHHCFRSWLCIKAVDQTSEWRSHSPWGIFWKIQFKNNDLNELCLHAKGICTYLLAFSFYIRSVIVSKVYLVMYTLYVAQRQDINFFFVCNYAQNDEEILQNIKKVVSLKIFVNFFFQFVQPPFSNNFRVTFYLLWLQV